MTFEKSCGAVVFTVENGVVKYVLVQQTEGFWGFPEGRNEVFETESGCAYRDVYEEVGLNVEILSGFRESDEHLIPGKDVIKKTVYFCAHFEDQEIIKQDAELLDVRLVTIEEAEKLIKGTEENEKHRLFCLELLKRADGFIKEWIMTNEQSAQYLREKEREYLSTNNSGDITLRTMPCENEFRRKVEERLTAIDGDGFVDGSFN